MHLHENKLNQAVKSKDIKKVELLLNKERTIFSFSNSCNNYAIVIASKYGYIDI